MDPKTSDNKLCVKSSQFESTKSYRRHAGPYGIT